MLAPPDPPEPPDTAIPEPELAEPELAVPDVAAPVVAIPDPATPVPLCVTAPLVLPLVCVSVPLDGAPVDAPAEGFPLLGWLPLAAPVAATLPDTEPFTG